MEYITAGLMMARCTPPKILR